MSGPPRPLDGIVVLDLAHHLSGPVVTRSLLDLGAVVVKIEPPGGEPLRSHGPKGDVWMPSPTFLALHRDKLSLELDLKSELGRTALVDLARNADVLVENFRPGVSDRLGIGYEQLRLINPRLVYCSVSGFGSGGPMSNMGATDGVVQGFSGVLEMLAPRGEPFGQPAAFAIMDMWSGAMGAQAVLAALFQRTRTGVGTNIDISMIECAMFARMLNSERGLESPNTVLATTRDGVRIVLQTVPDFVPRFFEMLSEIPECSDIATDPRFATPSARVENEALYIERVRAGIVTRTADEWFALFMKAGVPASPVNTAEQALHHPQVTGRGSFVELDIPGLGHKRLPTPPFLSAESRGHPTTAPVKLGTHNAEVMRRFAGYSDEQIAALFGTA